MDVYVPQAQCQTSGTLNHPAMGPIEKQQMAVREELSKLSDTIGILEQRIGAVLAPPCPIPTTDKGCPVNVESHLCGSFRAHADQIRILSARVNELIQRCEL
jgi:hypothetical protein